MECTHKWWPEVGEPFHVNSQVYSRETKMKCTLCGEQIVVDLKKATKKIKKVYWHDGMVVPKPNIYKF